MTHCANLSISCVCICDLYVVLCVNMTLHVETTAFMIQRQSFSYIEQLSVVKHCDALPLTVLTEKTLGLKITYKPPTYITTSG